MKNWIDGNSMKSLKPNAMGNWLSIKFYGGNWLKGRKLINYKNS